jgi:hypothetical protein
LIIGGGKKKNRYMQGKIKMFQSKWTIVLLIGIQLMNCLNEPENDETKSFAYPLEIGNKWTYEIEWTLDDSLIDSAHIISKITNRATSLDGYNVYEMRDSTDSTAWNEYYKEMHDGLYLFASESGGLHTLWKKSINPQANIKNPPVLLVPYEFSVGEEWVYDTLKDSLNNRIVLLKRRYIGLEKVTSKAGIFECFKFETAGYGGEKRYHYYADEIGLVQKEEIIDSFAITGFNPVSGSIEIEAYKKSIRTFTLVSY